MDGLAIGLANVAFAFFMLASINSGQTELVSLFSILLGIGIGLLVYNISPAKLFLGETGAQSIGFLLAALAILYHPAGKEQTSTWFVKVMLMAVPIFDTTLVFFSRLRKGHAFYIAGQDHTYHRLVSLGLPSGRAVAIIQMAAFMINCLAFIAVALPPLFSNIIFGFTLALGFILFFVLEKKPQTKATG
jgi:UDP-GlcNAc:undecaprenyl-phosphate GlcNAc-1-phosphate transferase